MRKIFLFCVALIVSLHSFAIISLSPESKVSILTCGSGDELYSIFGHTGIRIHDPENGMDLVFNYGTFDFNDEQFYTKFVRGKLDYFLSASSYQDFIGAYMQDDRSVTEQILNISYEQKQDILEFLYWNYKDENKYYKYDFFKDNCTTKIRDILNNSLKQKLVWDQNANPENLTFRKMLDPNIVSMPWIKAGFYLGLGSVCDVYPNHFEKMFLPDKLYNGIAKAELLTGKISNPLVKETINVYTSTKGGLQPAFDLPQLIAVILFLATVGLSLWQYWKRKELLIIDKALWYIVSIISVLLFFLWFATDHPSTKVNYNLLWASPICIVLLFTCKSEKFIKMYNISLGLLTISCSLVLISGVFKFQSFHILWGMFAPVLMMRVSLIQLLKRQNEVASK